MAFMLASTAVRTSSATTTGLHSSQDDLDSLIRKIGSYPRYRSITEFYHVTKLLSKINIDLSKELQGSLAKMTRSPSNHSPIHHALSGVFFGCNLHMKGYSLPDSSPFGTERIKIPITEIADQGLHLFYNSHHSTQSTVYYVILVLVKESSPKYKYCRDHMIELDMKSNGILQLNFEQGTFKYCQPYNFKLWVEVFMVGDLSLEGLSYSWDKVSDTGRHRSGPHLTRSTRSTHSTRLDTFDPYSFIDFSRMTLDSDFDDDDDDFCYGYDYDYD